MSGCAGIGGVVLAAGGARRMGGRLKQLLPCKGEVLVHRAARTALEAGLRPVWVVVGAQAQAVWQAVADLPVEILLNPAWEAGQSASVRLAAAALRRARLAGGVFFPADQPFVPPALVTALCEAYCRTRAPIVTPEIAGERSTPVLVAASIFPLLEELHGDTGARALFDRIPPLPLHWDAPQARAEIDTPADYRRWCPEGATWQGD